MQKFDIIFLSVIIALTTGKPKSPQRGVAQVRPQIRVLAVQGIIRL